MLKQITSLQNPFIKELVQLQEKSRVRKKKERFLIEGQREFQLALKGDYVIETIVFDTSIVQLVDIDNLIDTSTVEIIEVSTEVYQKIAYRSSTEGMIAIAKTKKLQLSTLQFTHEHPLLLIAEAPEKPGNIGAILRTADAAKVDAVIIANPKTDLYNPNIIRSSVGCLFTNTIATGSTAEVIAFLKERQLPIYCATLKEGAERYTEQDFTTATAIVVGTEATGLSDEWLTAATKNISIPMLGEIDSMNVSVAAGVLIYEAKRQRNFL